jgi:hypothetical protein
VSRSSRAQHHNTGTKPRPSVVGLAPASLGLQLATRTESLTCASLDYCPGGAVLPAAGHLDYPQADSRRATQAAGGGAAGERPGPWNRRSSATKSYNLDLQWNVLRLARAFTQ